MTASWPYGEGDLITFATDCNAYPMTRRVKGIWTETFDKPIAIEFADGAVFPWHVFNVLRPANEVETEDFEEHEARVAAATAAKDG